MSDRIDRTSQVHLNIKDQDRFEITQGRFGTVSEVTLVVMMNAHNPGCGPDGRLYLNDISLAKLEALKSEIERFLGRIASRGMPTSL